MASIEDLKERKKKLEDQIKEKERKLEQSVGRYFLKQFPADNLTEAKSTIDELQTYPHQSRSDYYEEFPDNYYRE